MQPFSYFKNGTSGIYSCHRCSHKDVARNMEMVPLCQTCFNLLKTKRDISNQAAVYRYIATGGVVIVLGTIYLLTSPFWVPAIAIGYLAERLGFEAGNGQPNVVNSPVDETNMVTRNEANSPTERLQEGTGPKGS